MTKRPALPKVPFVLVAWEDAWKSAVEDVTLDNAGDGHKPITCLSAGWVVRDDEAGIQLAAEHSPNGTFRHLAFIPRKMIVKVEAVKLTMVRNKEERQRDKRGILATGIEDSTGGVAGDEG